MFVGGNININSIFCEAHELDSRWPLAGEWLKPIVVQKNRVHVGADEAKCTSERHYVRTRITGKIASTAHWDDLASRVSPNPGGSTQRKKWRFWNISRRDVSLEAIARRLHLVLCRENQLRIESEGYICATMRVVRVRTVRVIAARLRISSR